MTVDINRITAFVDQAWDASIVPALKDYIRIPNKSPAFDAAWASAGHMTEATRLLADWCCQRPLAGMSVEVLQLPGRTPVILIDVPGASRDRALLYGHLDKQPEMSGWRTGLGPWTPVLDGDRLYGRGGADDGYAVFGALTALEALQREGIPHAHCVVLIEACEESGSYDLPPYLETFAERIGSPSLVVCLDSGCGNYDQLWSTTSLRGMAAGTLTVDVLCEGVHSGDAGGVVPSSFRVLRQLLSRLEDERTGAILPAELNVEIPIHRRQQAEAAAKVLGTGVYRRFPFQDGAGPQDDDPLELILNRTWRPALEVIGAAGMPSPADAGNVLRPTTALEISLRLPPSCDAGAASDCLKNLLERDPPCGARVHFEAEAALSGWNAPAPAAWLAASLENASRDFFGAGSMSMGEGGSIPFMAMLGEQFPQAQFLITGVLGPEANAHGPNEFLHIPTARKLTCCVATVLQAHCDR